MDFRPLMNDALIERLVLSGPQLDAVEQHLPPHLRETLAELQRIAADSYASGNWQVEATGETISIAEPRQTIAPRQAQEALGHAYLASESQGRGMLKAIMADVGLTPSAGTTPSCAISR